MTELVNGGPRQPIVPREDRLSVAKRALFYAVDSPPVVFAFAKDSGVRSLSTGTVNGAEATLVVPDAWRKYVVVATITVELYNNTGGAYLFTLNATLDGTSNTMFPGQHRRHKVANTGRATVTYQVVWEEERTRGKRAVDHEITGTATGKAAVDNVTVHVMAYPTDRLG